MRKLLIAAVVAGLFASTSLLTGCSNSYESRARARKYKLIFAQDQDRAVHDMEAYLGLTRAGRLSPWQVYAE